MMAAVTEQLEPAEKARARRLVLHCQKDHRDQWRFALYNDVGILCGVLPDLPWDLDPEQAQAALLRQVERDSGLTYVARWKLDNPGWWSTDLDVEER